MTQYLIGIDIGTSATKTVLFDDKMNVVCEAGFGYPLYQKTVGYAEQNPEDWAKAALDGIKAVIERSKVPNGQIRGIGLSGQMHGLVMLDGHKKVLRRSIVWCDQRTGKERHEITEKAGAEKLISITANSAQTGFTLAKILWVKRNEPQIFAQCRHILLPKDYVRFVLTGILATEVSDAGGTQLMDIKKRCWSREILSVFDIDEGMLPALYESSVVSGCVNRETTERTGLKEGTPVVGGAGDQAASAIGNGIVCSDKISLTLGSSGVLFAATENPLIDPLGRVHTLCHAIPGMWHNMSVTQGCGISLKWFKDHFCEEESRRAQERHEDVYDSLFDLVSALPAGSDGLVFLPYLMGERSPHLDEHARGVFFGLTNLHTKAHLFRSVVEGVTFSQTECYEIMTSLGFRAKEVRLGGGGSKSPVWRQMIADNFNADVCTLHTSETGAMGVAILAGVGVGLYKDVPAACEQFIRIKEKTTPTHGAHETYQKNYTIYKKLYENLKEIYRI